MLNSEMPKNAEEPGNVTLPSSGVWVWNDEAQSLEFVRSDPKVESLLKKRRETNVSFSDLHHRNEGLAQFSTLNNRGRQSTKKTLSPARLNAYRSSLMQRQGDHVTIDDVKQVAVSLLQENYSLPIPSCFLAVLKSKELDEFLAALLLYLSCYFEHKSLENKPKPLIAEPSMTERQMMAKTLAKVEMVQKKLAVCYFSLVMGPEMAPHQNTAWHKSWVSSTYRELLLHECLYSFFCYVSWVAFGRKHLRVIQEEVGRLLHSDTFNTALRNRTDGKPGETLLTLDGSVNTGRADPKGPGGDAFKQRKSQKRPGLSSIVTQRSPLMVSLLPLPKEQSPHLFLGSRARRQSSTRAELGDTDALMEELDQQLASVSFGILGKPLRQFSCATLMPKGAKKKDRDDEDDEDDENDDAEDDNDDHLGVRVRGSRSSFARCKSTGIERHDSTSRTNTGISRATTEAMTSDTE